MITWGLRPKQGFPALQVLFPGSEELEQVVTDTEESPLSPLRLSLNTAPLVDGRISSGILGRGCPVLSNRLVGGSTWPIKRLHALVSPQSGFDMRTKVVLPGFSQYAHDRPGIGYRLRISSQRTVVQSGRGDELQPFFWYPHFSQGGWQVQLPA